MKVAVIGTGYVGLVAGACFAETGNDVVCADIDAAKIDGLRRNVLPIYEPGLEELVERNQAEGRLVFTTDVGAAVADAAVAFIAVGTPPDEDGSADLRYVLAVAATIARHAQREIVVVTKSTVPVGTAAKVRAVLAAEARVPFHVCSNPEFLKEGAAIDDFLKPDRVVVGTDHPTARAVMDELYGPFVRTGKPILHMDIPSAEMTKYAANAMLATRISFMNEMANLCDVVGANVDQVRRGIGSDARIGPSFLFPGPGYGGSCFPKDVQALLRTAGEVGMPLEVVGAVERANARQKRLGAERLRTALGGSLAGRRIALWGLAFKPNTDDMREAPALTFIDDVLAEGATVVAHDPEAMDEARRRLGDRIAYATGPYDALPGADALVIMTEWNVYRNPDFARVRAALASPLVVDLRNLYDPARMAAQGFRYVSIGRPAGREA
jgi:UDPglucose 6-dehydrogenase